MESLELKTSSSEQSKIFQTVDKAVIQLNTWLASIETSFKAAISVNKFEKENKLKEIYEKMNNHFDRLTRIVQICHDLSKKNKTEDMNLINEYISFMVNRFNGVYNEIELHLKEKEIDDITLKCENVCEKIVNYNNSMQSLCGILNKNNKTDLKQELIKEQLNNLKTSFHQYSFEIEKIKNTVLNLVHKPYTDFLIEVKKWNSSLTQIETTLDNQWTLIIHICKQFCNQLKIFLTELNESASGSKLIKENFSFHISIVNFEAFLNIVILEDSVEYFTILPTCPYQKANTSLMKIIYRIPDVCFKEIAINFSLEMFQRNYDFNILLITYFIDTYNNDDYLRMDYENTLKLCSSPFQSDIHFHFQSSMKNSQNSSSCSISNFHYTSLMLKSLPDQKYLKFLNSSLFILNKDYSDQNGLYQNLINLDQSKFENQYEFLSDRYSIESIMNGSIHDAISPSKKISKSSTLTEKMKNKIILFATNLSNDYCPINFLRGVFLQNLITKKELLKCFINLLKRTIQFDLSLGCLLLVKEIVYYFVHKVQFNEMINSIVEINEYRKLSATV